jgi:hypothetical protein
MLTFMNRNENSFKKQSAQAQKTVRQKVHDWLLEIKETLSWDDERTMQQICVNEYMEIKKITNHNLTNEDFNLYFASYLSEILD